MANDNIEFDIVVNGKPAKRGIEEVEKAQKSLGSTTDKTILGMKASWVKLGAYAYAAKKAFDFIKDIGDEWTSFSNKIKLSTSSVGEYNTAQKELFRISQETSSAMGGTVDLFQKLSMATRDLGMSQSDVFGIIETVNQSLIISGASASEADSSIRQLGQGLASGVLRGDEFNSIMENSPRISKALSDSLGVTIGRLREMAENGELTSEVVSNALKSQASVISKEYDGMTKTVDQSMVVVSNSMGKMVSGLNDSLNGTGGLAEMLQSLAKYFDENRDEIIDFGEDIAAVATIVANGLYSIYLTSKSGFIQLTLMFKKEIEFGLNEVIKLFEETLNAIIKAVDEAADYWGKVFNTDFGKIGNVELGKISIDDKDLQKSLDETKAKIQELGRSTDEAFKEIATKGVKKKVIEIEAVITSIKPKQGLLGKVDKASKNKELRELERMRKEAARINDQFWDDYKRSSMSAMEYELDALNTQYMEYEKHVKDKAALNEWLAAEQKRIMDENNFQMQAYIDMQTSLTDGLTDAIVKFAETGKVSFSEMARSIISDLARIQIQASMNSLMSGIFSSIGGALGGGSFMGAFANGAAFNNGKVTPFANGGVVGSPTLFPMANGTGLMGEAGPEAIVPLTRTSGGDLGIKATSPIVNVNVQNYGNDNVKVEQSGDNINVIISQIATSIQRGTGDIGSAIEGRYGIRKK